ncbi:hypothetical protein ACFLYR_07355 [Chloroflexota bacterium]
MSIEEFCREFYDSQIFKAEIAGIDATSVLWDTIKKTLVDADDTIESVDQELFVQEMTALRLELFALAWTHKFKKERNTIPQSIFTRQYLDEIGKSDIWEIMGKYSLAVAQSTSLKADCSYSERLAAKGNLERSNAVEKWYQNNVSDDANLTESEKFNIGCAARVFNRIGADIKREDYVLCKRVATRLADRIECSEGLKTEALLQMAFVVRMLYNGAKDAIESINLLD